MAKIKKVDSAILHLSNKHVSGSVHPRLQKHVRQIPKVDPRIVAKKRMDKLRAKSKREKHDHMQDKEDRAKYEFPFDKGYQKWLDEELNFSRLSSEEQKETAESSKYQTAYEKQSGLSYKDGSKLGGGGNLGGYSAGYIKWVSGKIKHWNELKDKEKLQVLDDGRPQSDYTKESGLDPKTGQPVKKDDGKGSGYTAEYVKWVRNELSPKSPSEEEAMKADSKVQQKYTQSTGKKPKG